MKFVKKILEVIAAYNYYAVGDIHISKERNNSLFQNRGVYLTQNLSGAIINDDDLQAYIRIIYVYVHIGLGQQKISSLVTLDLTQ